MAEKPPRRPLPRPEGLAGEFFRRCAGGRLEFQRCSACGAWRHLPRDMCAGCGSPEWEWQPSSGRGRLHSWTVTHHAPHPAFADRVPYAVVVVEMEEGVRLASGLRGLDPAELELELPVEVDIEVVSDEVGLPWFRPAARKP